MFVQKLAINGVEYQTTAQVNRDALEAGRLQLDLRAERLDPDGEGGRPAVATIELGDGGAEVVVRGENGDTRTVSVETALPADDGDVVAAEDEALGHGTGALEDLLDSIPSGDPVLGCLIKGAAVTTVIEVIRCWAQTDPGRSFPERARAVADCLKSRGWRIAWKFLLRVGKCVVRAGA